MKFKLESNFKDNIDRLCKLCGEYESECVCNKPIKILNNDTYKITLKTTKINQKTISIISPFYTKDIKLILSFLKKKFACGGSFKKIDDYYEILLQGDFSKDSKDKVVLEMLHLKFDFQIAP